MTVLPIVRRDNLLIQRIDDELVVYDQERDKAHSLNRTAALIFQHCNGETSVAELASLLPRELGLPQDEDVVWLALDRFDDAHLLVEPVQRPADAMRPTRRQMIQKLGLAAGLAVLLPTIKSISAPTPAAAFSAGSTTDGTGVGIEPGKGGSLGSNVSRASKGNSGGTVNGAGRGLVGGSDTGIKGGAGRGDTP